MVLATVVCTLHESENNKKKSKESLTDDSTDTKNVGIHLSPFGMFFDL